MSFWGTTVITKLFTAIPFIGEDIVVWLWGDFSIGNATLNRFFSLHYLLPFIIVAMAIVHISLLHVSGSSNPVSCCSRMSKISFYPYFYYKDTFGFLVIVTFWYPLTVFFHPFIFTHAANFNPADPLVTPGHIVPEWYFLCFYAILRACPSKSGGIVCMFLAIVLIALLPILYTSPFKQRCLLYNSCFYNFSVIVYLLFKFGACPAAAPYMFYAQLCTTLYFAHFLLVLPCLSLLDRFLYSNISSLKI
jgi:quinol-cytochrome oxidoreductase complex cytochrome b subunit